MLVKERSRLERVDRCSLGSPVDIWCFGERRSMLKKREGKENAYAFYNLRKFAQWGNRKLALLTKLKAGR